MQIDLAAKPQVYYRHHVINANNFFTDEVASQTWLEINHHEAVLCSLHSDVFSVRNFWFLTAAN